MGTPLRRNADEIEVFLQGDWWEIAPARHKTRRACAEVLSRLPEEVKEQIIYRNEMILLAPGKDLVISRPVNLTSTKFEDQEGPLGVRFREHTFRFSLIYLSDDLEEKDYQVILAVVAHEIAHSVTGNIWNDESEVQADRLITEWGFGEELQSLREENPRHRYG